VIDFLQKKGPGFHPMLTKTILASKTDEELCYNSDVPGLAWAGLEWAQAC